jgi:hypothetical protein
MKVTTRSKKEVLNGNFGASRVQARPGTLDLTKEILTKDNLRIPNRDDAFERLVTAYNKTTDRRLKATLWEMLQKRKATLQTEPTRVIYAGDPPIFNRDKLNGYMSKTDYNDNYDVRATDEYGGYIHRVR